MKNSGGGLGAWRGFFLNFILFFVIETAAAILLTGSGFG